MPEITDSNITLLPGIKTDDISKLEMRLMAFGSVDGIPSVAGRVVGFYRDLAYHKNEGTTRHRLWALVAVTQDEHVAELEAQLADSKSNTRKWCESSAAFEKVLKDERNARQAMEKSRDSFRESYDAACAGRDNTVKMLHKLEADLAKVKKHFGEKAYAEALACNSPGCEKP